MVELNFQFEDDISFFCIYIDCSTNTNIIRKKQMFNKHYEYFVFNKLKINGSANPNNK